MKIYIIIIIIIHNIFIINTIRSLPLQDEHAKGQYRAFQVIQGDEKISKLSILAPYWWASTVNKSQWKKSECKKGKNGFTRRWNFTIFKIRPTGLPTHLPTLPGLLRDAGYSTHLVEIYQNHKWFFFYKKCFNKIIKITYRLRNLPLLGWQMAFGLLSNIVGKKCYASGNQILFPNFPGQLTFFSELFSSFFIQN